MAGVHHNQRLQEAWNSDGELAFEFVELEVAPAYLQPLQLQKWLLAREHDLIRTYKGKGLAFNIVDAELVQTRAAATAATEKCVPPSKLIYAELQRLKPTIVAAEAAVHAKSMAHAVAESKHRAATTEQKQSIGFFRSLFGRNDRPEDLERARQVEIASALVAQSANELAVAQRELNALLERRRDLHNLYPGNVRRASVRSRAWRMF